MIKKITVLLPVLNEEENVKLICGAVKSIFELKAEYKPEIIFIDDGSTDCTLNNIIELSASDPGVHYISFSRNFGKDNAIAAGLVKSTGDAVITMDADMQHAPFLINELISHWEKGHEVVSYYREDKNKHTGFLSHFYSAAFYKLINLFASVKLEKGLSDFRIMDRKVVNALSSFHEDTLFFRGMIKWVGFRQLSLPYSPEERHRGKTSYKRRMLLKLAIHSVMSFSTKPLSLAIYLGFFFSFLSLLYIPYALFSKLHHIAVSGWASVIVTIAFFGGLNLMILGIVGLYLGKTFMQGKGRPLYIIRESNII